MPRTKAPVVPPPAPSHPTSLRLSEEGTVLLGALEDTLGLKRSQVIELALRKLARAEGIGGSQKKSATRS